MITLKGAFRQGRRKSRGFRRALVVAQFVISIILISCTLVVHHQLRFIQERPLGFDKNLVVTVPVSDESVNRNPEILRQALLRDPRVSGVAFSSDLPSAIRSSSFAPLGKTEEGKYLSLYTVDVDADFLILYGIKILKGRNFSPRIPSDAQGAKILNEAARKALGPDDPLDKPFALHNYPPGQVIGIVADFHFSPLTQRIEPLAINILPRYEDRFFSIRYASIKIGSGNVSGTLKFIEKTFRTLSPGSPFSYGFLNDQIEAAYVAEKKIAKSLVYFTFLAIAVSCLGLFGLASYVAEQRTKEIGIRKVLGASVPGIVILISQEFLQCVGIAYLLAWPATYFFLRSWLRNFAYRTPLRIDAFVLSAGLSLAIALLTVGGQALRAARTDPVRSLRYE